MSKAVFCTFLHEFAGRAMQMDSDLLLFEGVLPREMFAGGDGGRGEGGGDNGGIGDERQTPKMSRSSEVTPKVSMTSVTAARSAAVRWRTEGF